MTTELLLLYSADGEIVVQRAKVSEPVGSVESKEWAGHGGLKERGLSLSERCPLASRRDGSLRKPGGLWGPVSRASRIVNPILFSPCSQPALRWALIAFCIKLPVLSLAAKPFAT